MQWNFPFYVGAINRTHQFVSLPVQIHFTTVIKELFIVGHLWIYYGWFWVKWTCFGWWCHWLNKIWWKIALALPNIGEFPNFAAKLPYVFVSDDVFSLSKHLTKPYKGSKLTNEQLYNYCCSIAWGVSENAFGILPARSRIFLKSIYLSPEKFWEIVLACCYLHNYIKKMRSNKYMPKGSVDKNLQKLEK